MSNNRKKDTLKLSYGSKDRAVSLLRSLVRARYFGDTLPPIADLSRRLRIPKSSLTLAVHRLSAEGYLVETAGDGWHYPGWINSNPVGQVVFVVNMDLMDAWHGIFQDWLIGFEHIMADEGYETFLAQSFRNVEDKVTQLQARREQGFMGLVLSSFVEPKVQQFVMQTSVPAVILGNAITNQEDIGTVCSDNHSGVKKVVDFLTQKNHRDIAFYAAGIGFHEGFRQRYTTYKDYMRDLGLNPRTEFLHPEPHHAMTASQTAELFMSLKNKPSAVICASDREAFELISELKHLGISVPSDLSITGFANSHYAEILEPPLTTIDIFPIEMGRVAANYLLNEMQAPQLPVHIQLPTKLVVRQSVGNLEDAPPLTPDSSLTFSVPDTMINC